MFASPLYPRSLVPAVKQALADTPVVCLAGARQTGKTTLIRAMMPERAYFSLDDAPFLDAAKADPAGVVAALPRMVAIDEIQRAPELLPAIKLSVDMDRAPGRFVLAGSANLLLLPMLAESLAGRMETIRLMPLAESEKERKPGRFLRDLLAGAIKPAFASERRHACPIDLGDRLVKGGYPEPLARRPARARRWCRQYVSGIVQRDVFDVANVRNTDAIAQLLRLLAVRTGERLNASGLSRALGLNRETVREYISALERLFLVRRLPAWRRNVGKRLIKAPKTHVVDSGLAATLAGLESSDWIAQRMRMGRLLESFVFQQLRAQAGWTDPDIQFHHYRDRDQREVDLVITRGRRVWGVQVKFTSAPGRTAGRGMARLASLCGKDFQGGFILYNGYDTLPLSSLEKRPVRAVPLRELWNR